LFDCFCFPLLQCNISRPEQQFLLIKIHAIVGLLD